MCHRNAVGSYDPLSYYWVPKMFFNFDLSPFDRAVPPPSISRVSCFRGTTLHSWDLTSTFAFSSSSHLIMSSTDHAPSESIILVGLGNALLDTMIQTATFIFIYGTHPSLSMICCWPFFFTRCFCTSLCPSDCYLSVRSFISYLLTHV